MSASGLISGSTGLTISFWTYAVSIPVALVSSLIFVLPLWLKNRSYRWQGITLLSIYALYIVFLMIMTNYYYSIGGIMCLVAYGVYKYLSSVKKVTFINFIKTGFNFCLPILLGVISASIIVIPTIAKNNFVKCAIIKLVTVQSFEISRC